MAQRAATATTLRETVALYVQRKTLRPATIKDMMGHHDRNFSDWLDRPVAGITKAMCLERFLRITKQGNAGKGAPHTANAAFVYLRSWLNFAREHHANPDGAYPILPVNPVTQMWKTQDRNEEVPRSRAVPLDRVGHVWNYLAERRGQTDADLVTTLLLTGGRLTEISSLRGQDVDLEKRTITLRGDVVKNHKEMILPMSNLLHEVLAARCDGLKPTAYVFASDLSKAGYLASPRAIMERVAEVAGCALSPHDLRRSLDAMAQACKIDSDTRRLMLNHISGDVHFKSYASRQGLAAAFEAVGQFVDDAAIKAKAANVVPLFPARATA
jgi:integrase